jgi:hypothetical protein
MRPPVAGVVAGGGVEVVVAGGAGVVVAGGVDVVEGALVLVELDVDPVDVSVEEGGVLPELVLDVVSEPVLLDTVEDEPPRSTINVSMRVEQPKDESDPSFPSQ